MLRNWVSTNIWDQFVLCFLFSFFTRNRMQVKPLFLLFISIPLTGGQYIRDVYVEGMLNCFHLGLKTTEEVHITGVIFSRFPGERRQARSERGAPDMVPDRESPLGIKQRRFSFWKKLCEGYEKYCVHVHGSVRDPFFSSQRHTLSQCVVVSHGRFVYE